MEDMEIGGCGPHIRGGDRTEIISEICSLRPRALGSCWQGRAALVPGCPQGRTFCPRPYCSTLKPNPGSLGVLEAMGTLAWVSMGATFRVSFSFS